MLKKPQPVVPSEDPRDGAFTTVRRDARGALEWRRSWRLPLGKNKALAVRRLTDTALQGAPRILTADARARRLMGTQKP